MTDDELVSDEKDAALRKLINDEGGQSAGDLVQWLADWARQEGAPDGTAEWIEAQKSVVGVSVCRVLDWPRANYGDVWPELRGYLGEMCRTNAVVNLDVLRYVDGLYREALAPVAEWVASRRR